MFSWINDSDPTQVFWAKEYIAKKSAVDFSKLKEPTVWESVVVRDCDLTNQEVESYLKAMKAAWRKKLSRKNRKRDFAKGSKRERSFVLTNEMYFKLEEIAKTEGVTPSQVLERYIQNASPPVYE